MTIITIITTIALAVFWRDLNRQTQRVIALERQVDDLTNKPRVSVVRDQTA